MEGPRPSPARRSDAFRNERLTGPLSTSRPSSSASVRERIQALGALAEADEPTSDELGASASTVSPARLGGPRQFALTLRRPSAGASDMFLPPARPQSPAKPPRSLIGAELSCETLLDDEDVPLADLVIARATPSSDSSNFPEIATVKAVLGSTEKTEKMKLDAARRSTATLDNPADEEEAEAFADSGEPVGSGPQQSATPWGLKAKVKQLFKSGPRRPAEKLAR
ncbi:hypothetical protein HK405_006172 [Cladochytrium tenue]|nr:hypothetical protein HK405_006172 [Cladochytrium tenue]